MNTTPPPFAAGTIVNWELTLSTIIIPWTARVVVALAIGLITVLLASRIRASVEKSLCSSRADRSTALLVSRIAHIAVLAVGVLVEMGLFGINWTVLVAMISVISLDISLAVQDVLKSFVAGLSLLMERPFRIGEHIKFKDFTGEVEHVGIRTTVLRTEEGFQVVVPNSTIFVEVLINKGNSEPTTSVLADRDESLSPPR